MRLHPTWGDADAYWGPRDQVLSWEQSLSKQWEWLKYIEEEEEGKASRRQGQNLAPHRQASLSCSQGLGCGSVILSLTPV